MKPKPFQFANRLRRIPRRLSEIRSQIVFEQKAAKADGRVEINGDLFSAQINALNKRQKELQGYAN